VASGSGRTTPVQKEAEPQRHEDFFDSTFSIPQQSPDTVPSSPSRTLGSKNPYARLSLETSPPPANPVLAGYLVDEPEDEAPASPLNPFTSSRSKVRQPSEEIPVPTEPSAKALGKIRQVSGFQSESYEHVGAQTHGLYHPSSQWMSRKSSDSLRSSFARDIIKVVLRKRPSQQYRMEGRLHKRSRRKHGSTIQYWMITIRTVRD